MKYYDLTISIKNQMSVCEGDPEVFVDPFLSILKGDSCNVSNVQMGSHTGTHIDAPYHFFKNGRTVDDIPLDLLIGKTKVILIRNEKVITEKILSGIDLKNVERLLIKTDYSYMRDRYGKFKKNYTYIDIDAAAYIVNQGIKLLGIDAFSIEQYGSEDNLCHKILLGAGVPILELLNLKDVPPGDYELICLPLKIFKGDGAPVRAVVRDLS